MTPLFCCFFIESYNCVYSGLIFSAYATARVQDFLWVCLHTLYTISTRDITVLFYWSFVADVNRFALRTFIYEIKTD